MPSLNHLRFFMTRLISLTLETLQLRVTRSPISNFVVDVSDDTMVLGLAPEKVIKHLKNITMKANFPFLMLHTNRK